MAAPIYFLPRLMRSQLAPDGRFSRALLESRGLAGTLADVESLDDAAVFDLAIAGPGDEAGLLLTVLPAVSREPPRRFAYRPAQQQWRRLSDGCWIGWDPAEKPRPEDLARRHRLPGHWVELADGQRWEIPVLRGPGGGTSLPRTLGWDAAGNFAATIRPEYQRLWDDSLWTARLFYDADQDGKIDLAEAAARIVDALALNYRLGRAEASALGLIDSRVWQAALGATVDLPRVLGVARSSPNPPEPPSAATSPGSPDSIRATRPAGASCTSSAEGSESGAKSPTTITS